MPHIRDYSSVRRDLQDLRPDAPRADKMQRVVDALWDAFGLASSPQGSPPVQISWVGFYTKTPDADEMILQARRDKPACSPLGLQGCCGRCWSGRRPIVVRDVANMEGGYIACDPKDRSEVVVPLFEPDGSCWGVLDIDSYETSAFDAHDAMELIAICETAGLSIPWALAHPLAIQG